MRRILWMKGGGLGDFILAFPVLAALRDHFDDTIVEAVGPSGWIALAREWADALSSLDALEWMGLYGDGSALPERLAETDLVVLLRPDPRGLAVQNLYRAGVGRVLHRDPAPIPDLHQVDHLARVLLPLGIRYHPWPRLDRVFRSRNLPRQGPVALHPGSGGVVKTWPTERFVLLARSLSRIGLPVEVILGPVEVERGFGNAFRDTGVEIVVPPTVVKLAERLRQARLLVANDSGVSHLAAAVGCPLVVLFGPSDPAVWAPRGPRVQVVTSGGGDCARTSIASISFDQVLEAVRRNLEADTV